MSKDEFIEEVFELLFGDGAYEGDDNVVRCFSYKEAIEKLKIDTETVGRY